jgi:peptidoglycan/LPS O-acetylase OafA/YrhL
VTGSSPADTERRPSGDTTEDRLRSLDGIRGAAVVAVILFHAGVPGVAGGMLGVDVFFVLSGFLITALLCEHLNRPGPGGLTDFWAGRARRLLPALFLLLIGVALFASIVHGSLDPSSTRGDAISTLLYVANWHFVLTSQNYFALSAAPSPLLHMWSLGVEEQYYLLWPLIVLLVLRRGNVRLLAYVAAVAAIASALLMAVMYHVGFSTDRLYYGTDTRAQALLVGSALGALASTRQWHVVIGSWTATRPGRLFGGVVAIAGAGWLVWSWHAFDGQNRFLYQGGFLAVALAAGAVITSVTSWRRSLPARMCSLRPICYVGLISYGLYLYHWPLFLAIDHMHTGLSGSALFIARIAATFLVAVVSYHFIEQPIRTGACARHWRGLTFGAAGAVGTASVVLLATTSIPASANTGVTSAALSGSAIPAAEHQQLAAAHAFSNRPVRFLLTGDSVALTAGDGLSYDSVSKYGVKVLDEALPGFDLDLAPMHMGGIVWSSALGGPRAPWQPGFLKVVDRLRPEVAGLLLGRFELADHLDQGRWVHVGEPSWDAHLEGELSQAVALLSAHGARVVLFTFPYIDPPNEQPNGSPYPENLPSRVDAFNRLIREVAARDARTVSLVDLNRIMDPAGHFAEFVDSIQVRWPGDGVHVSRAGGIWLQPRILPLVASLGMQARATTHT